jgi:hypothetical protein
MNMNRLQADSSKTLCVRAAVRKDFMAWRPEFEPHRIKDSDSGEELLSMLGRGECDAALVIEDLYAGNSDTEPYCDVHVVENTSMSIPNAMPVPAPVNCIHNKSHNLFAPDSGSKLCIYAHRGR